MRILIHHPRCSYYLGGGEIVPLEQATALSRIGHQVELLTSRPPKPSVFFKCFIKNNPSIRVHYVRLPKRYQYLYQEMPGKKWSRWEVESRVFGKEAEAFYKGNSERWDVVVTHLLYDSLYIPGSFKNVLHLHGVPEYQNRQGRLAILRPDHFIAVSHWVKKGWLRLYPSLHTSVVSVCYNGIKPGMVESNQERAVDLLYVGRLLTHKGIYYIVNALALLGKRGVSPRTVIVGSGPEEKKLKKKVRILGLEKIVSFRKNISPKQLSKLYAQSKIFVCPSYKKEGVLATMLEAADRGSAVITARCCGMVEFAKHMINALLVKPKNACMLAEGISLLLRDTPLRQRLTERASRDIQNAWNSDRTVQQLVDIYNRIYS